MTVSADLTCTDARTDVISLDGKSNLSLENFFAVSEGEAQLELTEEAWGGIDASRLFLEQCLVNRQRIYGVTTGYGPLAGQYIDPEQSALLQRNLVYHLASGVGSTLGEADTRAILASRIVSLSRGHSAIRRCTLEFLLACLNLNITPLVPELGTVGASGDLTPLAHLALAWLGEAEVRFQGSVCQANEVFTICGLQAWQPDAKEGLALVNGTSAMTGIAARNAVKARRALGWALALSAVHGEVARVRQEAWSGRLGDLRPHAGQRYCHDFLNRWIAQSSRVTPWDYLPHKLGPARPETGGVHHGQELPQDPYTLRCVPQILGAVADSLDFHDVTVTVELNSVTDNPVFFAEDAQVVHGGNFYGQHVAFASDALHNAVIKMAILAERSIARVTDPTLSKGLPPFLQADRNGLQSGYMGAQVTASAVLAEMRSEAMPASIQSISTNASNQDVNPMGTIAARKASRAIAHLERILAIEAMVLCSAMELRSHETGLSSFSPPARQLLAWVRSHVAPLTVDRPLGKEIESLSQMLYRLNWNDQWIS